MRDEVLTATIPVRVADVSVRADGRTILDRVSVELTARRTAIIGANGSGKSTFARLLNGLVLPDEGHVVVRGHDTARHTADVRRRVGFVFTDPAAQILMPTPAEDLALSLRGLPRHVAAERVQRVLAEHGLSAHADTPVSALSGGQRQLLALAAVLIAEPAIVVADEPTTLLDLRNARRIGELLLAQPAQLVVVTHDLDLAERCDEALLFEGGRLVRVGAPHDVIAQYRASCA